MSDWVVTAAVALAAFLLGVAVGRARPRRQVVWSEPAQPPQRSAEVDDLIRRGQKIQAIKRYRKLHGTDLKTAKDAVEAIERQIAGES